MKQYGDITKLHGYDLDPVDLIVGGSPCQDLSVAGKRAGLDGERSGLFLEMIRIIREMREATHGLYPRYALWENVPGAFSSNNGKDFGAVLGEFARLIEPKAPDVPVPEKGWAKAGVLLVSNGSLAWRVTDAQYWGVPQRRRRISLGVDLRGESAAEILFERKGVSGNPEQSGAQGEDPAGSTETGTDKAICIQGNCIDRADNAGCNGRGWTEDVSYTLNVIDRPAVYDPSVHHGYKELGDISETVRSRYGTGGNNVPMVVERTALSIGNGQTNNISMSDKANALDTMHDQQAVLSFEAFGVYSERQTASTLKARNDGVTNCDLVAGRNVVRRLTPLECERLQGFPDRWTDVPGASDSKRYKALGNSIALPAWEFWARRFVEIGEVKTIGSLFDGIGGFPLVFHRAGAETKWTSEIDPFCESVVRYHCESGDL